MAREKMKTSEIVLLYDSSVLGTATDVKFSLNNELKDIRTLADAGWSKDLAVGNSWGVETNGFVTRTSDPSTLLDYDLLFHQIISTPDTSIYMAIKPNIANNKYWIGGVKIEKIDWSGKVGDVVTYSASFKGQGPLTESTTT